MQTMVKKGGKSILNLFISITILGSKSKLCSIVIEKYKLFPKVDMVKKIVVNYNLLASFFSIDCCLRFFILLGFTHKKKPLTERKNSDNAVKLP
jgi:hypothetical protein